MASSTVILLLSLLLGSTIALVIPRLNDAPSAAHRACGANEEWTNCGYCEEMCQNPWGAPGRSCPFVCGQKCICKEGFVRGWDLKCIRKSACTAHPQCAHLSCPRGTRCAWAPEECPVNTPNCPQVGCFPIYSH